MMKAGISANLQEQKHSYVFKLIIIGDSGVGKSCLLLQFLDHSFRLKHEPTIGIEFGANTLEIKDQVIKLQIWDTAGQESFRSITRGYYRSAAGAILVYDVTNEDSFHNLTHWLIQAKNSGNPSMSFLLVGNKSDLQAERKVASDQAQQFAQQNNMAFIETSAKTGQNVEASFIKIAEQVLLKIRKASTNVEANLPPGVKVSQMKTSIFESDKVKKISKSQKSKCCSE